MQAIFFQAGYQKNMSLLLHRFSGTLAEKKAGMSLSQAQCQACDKSVCSIQSAHLSLPTMTAQKIYCQANNY